MVELPNFAGTDMYICIYTYIYVYKTYIYTYICVCVCAGFSGVELRNYAGTGRSINLAGNYMGETLVVKVINVTH